MRLVGMTLLLFSMFTASLFASDSPLSIRAVDDAQVLLTWEHAPDTAQQLERQTPDGNWQCIAWDMPPHHESRGFYIDKHPQLLAGRKVNYRLSVYPLIQGQSHQQSVAMDDSMTSRRMDLTLRSKRWLLLKAMSFDDWATDTRACWANAAIWDVSGKATFLSELKPAWLPDLDYNQSHNTKWNWQTQTGQVRIPWEGFGKSLSSLLPGMFVFDLATVTDAQLLRTSIGIAMDKDALPSNKAVFSMAAIGEQAAAIHEATITLPRRTQSAGNTTYYLNAQAGNDQADGKTPQTAFQTLLPINCMQLAAGDVIRFAQGQHFQGPLLITSSGTAGKPITFTSDGQGNTLPSIDGDGCHNQAIRVENAEHLIIENLQITGQFATPRPRAAGIRIGIKNMATASNITLRKLNIHDVNGHPDKKLGFPSAGICIEAWGRPPADTPASYDNLLIENNTLTNVGRDGILLFSVHGKRDEYRKASTNVVVRNNQLADIPGDGISLCVTDNALIEHNKLTRIATAVSDHNAACGIWPWSSDNTLIQFNEVSYCGKGGHDGQALDADWNCNDTVFQFNYTHDNPNGSLLICSKPNEKNSVGNVRPTYRYNLSVNDGAAKSVIRITGDSVDANIHDNIFLSRDHMQLITLAHWHGAMPKNMLFANNQIITPDTASVACTLSDKTEKTFTNNHITTGLIVEGARREGMLQRSSDRSFDQWYKLSVNGQLLEQLVQLGQQEQNKSNP